MIRCRVAGRLPVALLAALLIAASTTATEPPVTAMEPAKVPGTAEPASIFTERIDVNLVNLNVVVTSVWGRQIIDLTRDDFEIWEDGERREISHFSRVIDGVPDAAGETAALASALAEPGATRSDATRPGSTLDRSIVLAFDASIQLPYLKRAVRAARNFVAERSNDGIRWSVVMLSDRPYSLVPLTDDSRQVVEALDSVLANHAVGVPFQVPSPARSKGAQLDGPWSKLAFTEQSLTFSRAAASLSEIFRAYASAPGAKACVVYQQGGGGSSVTGASQMLHLRSHVEIWRDLARQATSAGFKVYVMDVLGLNMPSGVGSGNLSAVLHSVPSIAVDAVGPAALARATGGEFFALNHLDEAVKAAVHEQSTFYTLAFAAPRGHDGEAHSIEVKVPGRRWLEVRHSLGFFDVDPRTLLVEHLAAPAYFPKRGAFPLSLEIISSQEGQSHDDRPEVNEELELIATAATSAEHLTLVPEGGAHVAAIDVFVVVHEPSGALVSLAQDRWRLQAPAATGRIEFDVPMRLRRPAAGYTVTLALHDPVSGLSGIVSEVIAEEAQHDG